MSRHGSEIHRAYDEYGIVQIYDDGEHRYLAFGSHHEQSCVLKRDPAYLAYDYTRAMLLPLLFEAAPKRALVLGLGAGSLASCLNRHCRQLKITAVELRPLVIEAAYKYFQLSRSKRLQVLAMDADTYLQQHRYMDDQPNKFNLIFSDIYGADDVDMRQLQPDYLDQCVASLSDNGWLVLNCWKQHQGETDLLPALRERFAEIRICNTQAGNWVILASRQTYQASLNQLRDRARQWNQTLGFALPLARLQTL